METVAFLFHDATGEEVGKFDLKAGDDAKALKWMEVYIFLKKYVHRAGFLQTFELYSPGERHGRFIREPQGHHEESRGRPGGELVTL